jgi:hypothetical protein
VFGKKFGQIFAFFLWDTTTERENFTHTKKKEFCTTTPFALSLSLFFEKRAVVTRTRAAKKSAPLLLLLLLSE